MGRKPCRRYTWDVGAARHAGAGLAEDQSMRIDPMTELSWIYDLYRLGQGGVSQGNPTAIYQQILSHVVTGLGAENGSLALADEDNRSLTIVAGIDLPAGVVGRSIAMGEGVFGWVAQEGSGLLLNGSIATDPRFKQREKRAETSLPNSAMCWPLVIEKRVIGAVSLNRSAGRPPFAEADLEHGTVLLNLVSLALENIQLQIEQQRRVEELKRANRNLEEAHTQLLQSEKMASIGQLAAGVAHEINNPIGYVYSNLGSLERYLADLLAVLDAYENAEAALPESDALAEVGRLKSKLDLSFLRKDLPALMGESKEGITRVRKIVHDLKDFSHVDDSDEWQCADLHRGLDSTLNIVWSELKYKAEVRKEYGRIPEVECLPSQINQVFMNLLVNAAHAIEGRGVITIRTGREGDQVFVEIADTGKGIPAENIHRIFDPFFTTKPVGKGTGLGLALSYGIVQKHKGSIEVASEVGRGTVFRVRLPLEHRGANAETDS